MSHECDGFLDEIAKHLFFVYFFVCFFYLAVFARVGLLKSWSSLAFLPTASENRLVPCTVLVRFLCFHVDFTVS